MKISLIATLCAVMIASCEKKNERRDDSPTGDSTTAKTYRFSNAYWYSSGMLEGSELYTGVLTVINKKPNHLEGVTTSYRVTISDIIRHSSAVGSDIKIGDIIQSETFREVVDGEEHLVCLSMYPAEEGDVVTDGGFPLHIDDKVSHAIRIIRDPKFDIEQCKEEDYKLVRCFLHNPDMYDLLRKNKKANKAQQSNR